VSRVYDCAKSGKDRTNSRSPRKRRGKESVDLPRKSSHRGELRPRGGHLTASTKKAQKLGGKEGGEKDNRKVSRGEKKSGL